MRYLGGKSRLAKDISTVLNQYRKDNQTYIEPFVGGGSILCKMTGDRYAYDIHYELIELYKQFKMIGFHLML